MSMSKFVSRADYWKDRAERAEAKLAELEGKYPVFAFRRRGLTDFCTCTEGRYAELAEKPHLFEVRKLYARPVPAEQPVNARLLDVATGKIQHRYLGLCPDSIYGTDSRDPGCPACQAITAADAAHTEPVNVDFGKRGENMFFKIGNQLFLLDYKPEEQDEFDCMKAILLSAFSRITQGVKTEIQPVNVRLLEAIKRLSFCAQTTGGTAGRDEGLCAAIGGAEKAIAAAEAQQERPGA